MHRISSDIRWFSMKVYSLLGNVFHVSVRLGLCINLMTASLDDSLHCLMYFREYISVWQNGKRSFTVHINSLRSLDTKLENSINVWRINCFLIASILCGALESVIIFEGEIIKLNCFLSSSTLTRECWENSL